VIRSRITVLGKSVPATARDRPRPPATARDRPQPPATRPRPPREPPQPARQRPQPARDRPQPARDRPITRVRNRVLVRHGSFSAASRAPGGAAPEKSSVGGGFCARPLGWSRWIWLPGGPGRELARQAPGGLGLESAAGFGDSLGQTAITQKWRAIRFMTPGVCRGEPELDVAVLGPGLRVERTISSGIRKESCTQRVADRSRGPRRQPCHEHARACRQAREYHAARRGAGVEATRRRGDEPTSRRA
jgi:hypothetical protein